MMIEEQNHHRYLYFAAKCSRFLANFYKALIFWFFCIKAKEQTEKKRTRTPKHQNNKPKKHTSHGLIKMALRKTAKRSDRKIYSEICNTAPSSE
jgi:hypothetical protein